MTRLLFAATLAALLAAPLPASDDGPLRQRERVEAALPTDEIKRSGTEDRNFYWQFRFYKGDAKAISTMLAKLAEAAEGVELILHEGNGKASLTDVLKAWGGKTRENLAAVASDGKHEFTRGRTIDPPMILSGEPFVFDWCVDMRQAFGPGLPPPEHARLKVTVHLYIGERADLFAVEGAGGREGAAGRSGRRVHLAGRGEAEARPGRAEAAGRRVKPHPRA